LEFASKREPRRHRNAGKTIGEILRGKKGSVKDAPLEEGSPAWNDILDKTWEDVEKNARENYPGWDTINKLLGDKRFDK
jgi:hypothetical protein